MTDAPPAPAVAAQAQSRPGSPELRASLAKLGFAEAEASVWVKPIPEGSLVWDHRHGLPDFYGRDPKGLTLPVASVGRRPERREYQRALEQHAKARTRTLEAPPPTTPAPPGPAASGLTTTASPASPASLPASLFSGISGITTDPAGGPGGVPTSAPAAPAGPTTLPHEERTAAGPPQRTAKAPVVPVHLQQHLNRLLLTLPARHRAVALAELQARLNLAVEAVPPPPHDPYDSNAMTMMRERRARVETALLAGFDFILQALHQVPDEHLPPLPAEAAEKPKEDHA